MTDDERAIRELVDAWFQATVAGDTAAVLDLMTEDVVFMVPGREPFGREAFAAASRTMEDARIEGANEIQELEVLGTHAWMRSQIRMTVTPPGGAAAVRRSGFALTVLRKGVDGRWRLARDANLVTVDE